MNPQEVPLSARLRLADEATVLTALPPKDSTDPKDDSGLRPALLIANGAEVGTCIPLPEGPGRYVVGRVEGADIRVDHPSVSRRHAMVSIATGAAGPDVILEDLGSTNGVCVEGERPGGPVRLHDRARLTLGDVELIFRLLLPMEIRRRQELVAEVQEAVRDPLTGCRSRRFLVRSLPPLIESHDRAGVPLSLALLDIDHFKAVNDLHGHPAGDEVLKRVAEAIRGTLRAVDFVVRYGGEEFVAVLPGATELAAAGAMERVRCAVEGLDLDDISPGLRVTLSAGYASRTLDEPQDAWLRRADDALYRAKRGGRNRVRGA